MNLAVAELNAESPEGALRPVKLAARKPTQNAVGCDEVNTGFCV